MELLKKFSLGFFFFIMISSLSFAQSSKSAPRKQLSVDEMVGRLEPKIKEWARRDALRMKQILALTDEQVKQAEEVRAEYVRQIFRMKFEANMQKSQNAKKFNTGLIGMLNPQQQETFRLRRKDIFPKG